MALRKLMILHTVLCQLLLLRTVLYFPRTQLRPTELLQELGNRGKTIITDTHDLEFVEQISKRAIVMGEDQMIKEDGNSKKMLDNLELLLFANLINEHIHIHGKLVMSIYMTTIESIRTSMLPEIR